VRATPLVNALEAADKAAGGRHVIDFCIDHPIFSTVLAIIITLAGVVALSGLPVARFPQITPPTIVVSAVFPGADAATIEQSIAAPIEEQVNGVPHMIYMDSKERRTPAAMR